MNNGLQKALANYLERGLTFACFRRPGKQIELWIQRTPELESVDRSMLYELNEVFLLAPFKLDDTKIQFIRADKDLLIVDTTAEIELFPEFKGARCRNIDRSEPLDKTGFEQEVNSALDTLNRGALEKVVLSRTVRTLLSDSDVPGLFLSALEQYAQAFVALVHTPEHGTWLGASPERSMHAFEEWIRVDAMAATRSLNDIPDDPDDWTAKERQEQSMVTTGMLRTLIELGLRETHTRGPEVFLAGNVAHLRTVVEADLSGRSLADVILALHPTAAVCGTPTNLASEYIAKHEKHDRELYGGFWGPWSADGETELFVNLRCLKAAKDHATLFVGAGIVAGSDPRQEWQETENKAATWLHLIKAMRQVSSPANAHQ